MCRIQFLLPAGITTIGLLAAATLSAAEPRIRVTPLGSLEGGNTETVAIDNQGRIGGQSGGMYINTGGMHAFMAEKGGPLSALDTLGFANSEVQAMNESGQVAGIGIHQNGQSFFRRIFRAGEPEAMVDLGAFPGFYGFVSDLNNLGDVVGGWDMTSDSELDMGAFAYTAADGLRALDGITEQPLPSSALAINDDGYIVGWAQGNDLAQRAVVWWPGTDQPFQLCWQGSSSKLTDINNSLDMIGELWEGGFPHALVGFSFCVVEIDNWIAQNVLYSYADVLTESGLVFGRFYDMQNHERMFMFDLNMFSSTILDLPVGFAGVQIIDANDDGHLLLRAVTENYEGTVFFWSTDTGYVDLGDVLVQHFDFPSITRGAINNLDQIVVTGEPAMNTRAALLIELLPPCLGDLDVDGVVGQGDLGIVLANFGCQAYDCDGDIDGDGAVGQSDLGLLLSNFGAICD